MHGQSVLLLLVYEDDLNGLYCVSVKCLPFHRDRCWTASFHIFRRWRFFFFWFLFVVVGIAWIYCESSLSPIRKCDEVNGTTATPPLITTNANEWEFTFNVSPFTLRLMAFGVNFVVNWRRMTTSRKVDREIHKKKYKSRTDNLFAWGRKRNELRDSLRWGQQSVPAVNQHTYVRSKELISIFRRPN